MQKEKKLKLCYTPTYNMPPGLKCVFLKTPSLHKHIANVKANVFFLVETKLTKNDTMSEYIIPVFKNHTEMIKHHMIHLDHHME